MRNRTVGTAVCIGIAAVCGTTGARAQAPARAFATQGGLVLSDAASGGVGASAENRSTSGTRGSITTITLQPAADYFVIDGLTLGAFVPFSYSSTSGGGPSSTLIGAGARLGYAFPFADSFSIWPRAGASFESTSISGIPSVTPGGTRGPEACSRATYLPSTVGVHDTAFYSVLATERPAVKEGLLSRA